ncbi:MAG: hypothetical protein JWO38_1263 [Gemmataceae bacterium]|nr:hypothetical protein [Gemmataceae bacterium]
MGAERSAAGHCRIPAAPEQGRVAGAAVMLFANPLLLFGLAAAAIPPLVHFFSRRRYDEVDWGAMRFLRLSPKSRRKLLVEHWVLMAVRMAVLGLLAVSLAGPAVRSTLFARAEDRRARSTVLLIDRSASMGHRPAGDVAKEWAATFLAQARPGDRVAVFAVKGDVIPVVASLTAETDQVRGALEMLPAPRGSADWPAAVEAAARLLESAPDEREIVVLTDGQRFGWADSEALARWEIFSRKLAAEGKSLPRVWVVDTTTDRPATPAGAILKPITANRMVSSAGTAVTFESGIRRSGRPGELPGLRLEVDGRSVGDVPLPPTAAGSGDVTVPFSRRFAPGPHLISLRTETDRQDFALDVVPTIPILVVDGETRPDARTFGSDFLRDALAPAKDPSPAFAVRTVPVLQFTSATLTQTEKAQGSAPRVLILANVATLSPEQLAAVERFLADGGGLLVAPGDRVEGDRWNRVAYRNGRGWLPARFVEVVGNELDPLSAQNPRTSAFEHPAVRTFRTELAGGLHTARFPRYWRLEPDPALPPSAILGPMANGDPFLVEKPIGGGRVVLAAVPLDNSWRTNLITLPDFVRLSHELVYYLAGTTGSVLNLAPGELIVFRPRDGEPPAPVTVSRPDGTSTVIPVRAWPAMFEGTRDPGAYKLTTGNGRVRYFAVRPDPREADLTPADEADRAKVAQLLGRVEYVSTPDDLRARRGRGPVTQEFGGLVLVAVLALLAAELWYSRKLARRDG